MMSIDLDELDMLDDQYSLFSRNGWNVYGIRDIDYLEPSYCGIKQKLIRYLEAEGFDTSRVARYMLQTFPRIFGYQFNPVSFYYLEADDGRVLATVAEVTNTYHEKKLFWMDTQNKNGWFKLQTAKDFYVSPFSQVNDRFDFRMGARAERWVVHINDLDQEGVVLLSSIRGKQVALTTKNLIWYIFRYPLLTLRVVYLIHWHALLMWIRKFPVSSKVGTAHHQKKLLRPHKSLTK